ncbi:UbiX family flavin prenyltransferase [Megasphaera paucivorans]|uniref:Flavin prenyltransferase UbiX n=1 Tax=Megasphaera paucivorans TaxID=349095 RepID=A0A1H0B7M2_9FIRM|nr:UbiX family flavin prenyltransferase [Megasphaera paucivorans]SDN41678.1 4-hydroxy-3-polyprenylbenzoate decarboxylase [Megasphaera paucivorans]
MKIIVGVSGASGIIYAIQLLKNLRKFNIETHLILSKWAEYNLMHETSVQLDEMKAMADFFYDNSDLSATIASGSFFTDGMIVVPCSMKTLAAITYGCTDTLLIRAADVTLKEKRKLVLVPRETPLSIIHLRNMFAVAQAGAMILPPMPAFYHHPTTINDIVDHTVSKILDQWGIDGGLIHRWEKN